MKYTAMFMSLLTCLHWVINHSLKKGPLGTSGRSVLDADRGQAKAAGEVCGLPAHSLEMGGPAGHEGGLGCQSGL